MKLVAEFMLFQNFKFALRGDAQRTINPLIVRILIDHQH